MGKLDSSKRFVRDLNQKYPNEKKFYLDRVAEPGLPQTLVRQLDLGHLCGGARYGGDLDDEHDDKFTVAAFLNVNGRIVTVLPLYAPRRCPS